MNSPFPMAVGMTVISERQLTDRRWRRRARERMQLASLSEPELHDLGLSDGSIYAELQKPFWRE